MCGLVSIISKHANGFFGDDVKIFTEMLFADQLRGEHGTGIIYNDGTKIKTLKAPIPSSEFIYDKQYDKAKTEIFQRARFVVGHNRAATIGNLTHQNTHPFRCGHITLVHNGTLTNHKNLADTENDSNAICQSIAKIGFKETVKKINGAFALIWYDEKQKTLNFTRNWQRPLWIVESMDLFCFVSEPKLAEWILERNKQKVTKVTEVETHTLYQFEYGNWAEYEKSKYTTYDPSTFQSPVFNHHTHHTPTTKSSRPTGSKIGQEITFIPVEVDKDNPEKLIGKWEDPLSGESIRCIYWASTKADAKKMLDYNGPLKGTVTQTGRRISEQQDFFIVRNAFIPNVLQLPKKGGITTQNGKKLTTLQAASLSKASCLYCGGVVGDLLHVCEVWDDNGELGALCPDCTETFYRKAVN